MLILFIILSASAQCEDTKSSFSSSTQTYPFSLQPLPYSYTFLEPFLPSAILYAHHDHHHQTYFDKLNSYVSTRTDLADSTLVDLVLAATNDITLQKFAGGAYNHNLYWYILTSQECSSGPEGQLLSDIERQWGSFDSFKEDFINAEAGLFGSGWVWACVNLDGSIEIQATSNQVNPLMGVDSDVCFPFLANDVWEHAYYLKYQWDKTSYFQDFFTAIDWQVVEMFYNIYATQFSPVPL